MNFAVMAGAIWVAVKGPDWLAGHPVLNKNIRRIRTVALTAVIASPALVLLRNIRHAKVRGNSVRLSAGQLPEIYATLQSHCSRLGMASVPELYLSSSAVRGSSQAYSAWHCDYIVLGTDSLEPQIERVHDLFSFLLARELGRIRLGHTRWWNEMLVAYVVRIPYLRNLLLHVRTFSKDRYGAFLAPDGVRGLLAIASGRRMLPDVSVPDFLRQAPGFRGPWAALSELLEPRPHVLSRINALYRAGLFRMEDDLRRFSGTGAAPYGTQGGTLHART